MTGLGGQFILDATDQSGRIFLVLLICFLVFVIVKAAGPND